MYRKISKKEKIMNILNRGSSVTWTQLKTTYNLKSPRAMIDTIRRDGFCVYANKDKRGNTFYRIGKPTGAMLKAGVERIGSMKNVTFDNIVAEGVRAVLGTKFAYTN